MHGPYLFWSWSGGGTAVATVIAGQVKPIRTTVEQPCCRWSPVGDGVVQGLFYHETSETNVSELFRYSGACGGGVHPGTLPSPPA